MKTNAIQDSDKKTRRNNGEGNICQRKDGRWMARVKSGKKADGKPNQVYFYGETRKEVAQKLLEFRVECDQKQVLLQNEILSQYITNWLHNVNRINIKPSSFDRNESTVRNQIIPRIGQYSIKKLTTSVIQNNLINTMIDENYSHSSIKKAHDCLNACMRYAVQDRQITYNPVDAVIMPKKSKFIEKEIVFFSEKERDLIVTTAEHCFGNSKPLYSYGAMLTFMLFTGIRPCEAIGLKWDQIDIEKRTMTVKRSAVMVKNREKEDDEDPNYILLDQESTKSNRERTISLSETAVRALETLKKNMTVSKEGYVMCTRLGNAVRPRQLRNVLDAVLKRANLRNAGLHSLRHTFATILFAKGVSLKIVSEILGHASVQVTIDIYIHAMPDDKVKAMQLLEAAETLEAKELCSAQEIMSSLKPLNSNEVEKMMKTPDFLRDAKTMNPPGHENLEGSII